MRLNAYEIADATGGTVTVPPSSTDDGACRICWDSREVRAGDLYVALPGERVDGHDFMAAAIDAGASAALVSATLNDSVLDAAQRAGCAIVTVENVQTAIVDLARAWRGQLQGKVMALTGSSGKTTTKNLVRDVLAAQGSVIATQGNQNNELGVPATLLRADEQTDAVIVEMGMRGVGQLEDLCAYVRPDMALVTNVGESHIELLGSRDNIAAAKAEALVALPDATGIAFLNASDDFAAVMVEHAHLRERGVRVVFFDGSGCNPQSYTAEMRPEVYASGCSIDDAGHTSFTLHTPRGAAPCQLQLLGTHNVHNACAAAAVGATLGMDVNDIVAALEAARSMGGRQQVVHTNEGATIIDDAYNANPDSMRASLQTFSQMKAAGQRIAVLGDMFELGDFALAGHAQMGRLAADAHLDLLICVGALSRETARAARDAGMSADSVIEVDDADQALALLDGKLSEGDVVLIKASHGVELDRVVKGLID